MSVEYHALSPMLIVFGAGVLGVLVEAFAGRNARYPIQLGLSIAGLVAGFVAVLTVAGTETTALAGAVAVDGPALFLQGTVLCVALATVLLVADRRLDRSDAGVGLDAFAPQAALTPGSVAELQATRAGVVTTEVYPLLLFAVGGMMLFPAADDLLTMFVALEVFSLPLYLLCGLARRRRLLSQEAALKYFLLGAFSSAIFLFGIALLYGAAGTLDLDGIAVAVTAPGSLDGLVLAGVGLLSVGLLFKVGAVPFHSWVPDVYQGAPTPITAFMAAATKIAAFGALLRIVCVVLPGARDDWRLLLAAVAILTMVAGAIFAVTQTDVKRMLAYSAIAHAGFLLTGVIAADRAGVAATLFYLAAYGFSTLVGFALVAVVRDDDGEVTELRRWAGLGKRNPLVGLMFALLLLAFAGIPLTSGFVAKFAVFTAAYGSGARSLVVVGVLASAIAAYFYVRVIVAMFFADPPADAPDVVVPSVGTRIVIAAGAVVTVMLGIYPQPLLDLATHAATFLA
ncbi:NADH-quinone oxidoreductase subunit NuoN [Skermania piniformis]|uniref:NADH-quinone oxidoreductase subunit N n=1 Tax=Skermania pinensis TaxID=39122 RepID=A0ABX8SDA4_9ACTN|nr:NADH-quinone oxidoreductase subunit NuoN [Skermania piniformis]QXQ15401.1 NADH-quinone oxidoreductase subunit NuoN [Skermania piniformis]